MKSVSGLGTEEVDGPDLSWMIVRKVGVWIPSCIENIC